jgi:5-hydroxyisourate hydrolase-like protein (transthyretin family)
VKSRSVFLITVVLAVLASVSVAQHTAVVTIEAKDITGAVVWGTDVSVVAKSQEQTISKVARTDMKGTVWLDLQPGTYDLTVKAKAFRAVTKRVVITGTNHQTFAFVLQVGGCPPGPCVVVTSQEAHVRDHCAAAEPITPNLHVSRFAQVKGRVLDATGAPFEHSRVELRRYVSELEQTPLRTVTTDAKGKFNLGMVAEGQYRLLASPTRAFHQADEMWCSSVNECFLDITLQANPTDMPDSQCPIR